MDETVLRSNLRSNNREGRPLRRRGVSFNVLPRRDESPTDNELSPSPILVDYASIQQRKQLNLTDFLRSDNPLTFLLFTFLFVVRHFFKLCFLPFVLVKHFYLLMLKVYGVRRSTLETRSSDLFSIGSTHQSNSQQRPIVWFLTLIDYLIFQLTRLPELFKQLISSIRRHVDGTVGKSFHLIDTCTSHQLSRTFPNFEKVFSEIRDKRNERNFSDRL